MTRIDPDVLAGIHEPQGLQISPDGSRIVFSSRPLWVRKFENLQSALWIADVGKEDSARQLTTDECNNHSPQFSPDGKYISFISDRAKPGRAADLYLLPLSGGEASLLTPKDNEMGVQMYQWRHDGKAIAYTSPDEKSEERKQRERDKNGVKVYGQDIDFARLRIIDVETKVVNTLKSVERHVTQIAWNSDSSKIAYATANGPEVNEMMINNHIGTVDIATDVSKELHAFKTGVSDLCWLDDRLIWTGCFDATSILSGTAVLSIPSEEPSDGYNVVSHGDTDCAFGTKQSNGKIVVHVHRGLTDILELMDTTELYRAKAALTSWQTHIGSSQITLAVAEGKVGVPTEVYSIKAGTKVKLSHFGDYIAGIETGASHLLEYTRDDGVPLDGLYAVPSSLRSDFEAHKPLPTVVVVHGGPYSRMTESFDLFFHFTTFLMSLGYLVLCPNYRGSSGHGHVYANSLRYDASKAYQDIIWLLRKGIDEGRVDPDRVAMLGWSYGGYMTYESLTRDSDFHFRAAVAGAGIVDWTAVLYTSGVYDYTTALSGPKPWEGDASTNLISRKCSPIFHMRDITTPVLIVHGDSDLQTPLEQAVGFYRGMTELGKDVTMVTYPGEGHGVPIPWTQAHYVDMLRRIEDFLKKHMD